MIAELWSQMIAVVRIELTKTFFARRSLWIYLLALLPASLFYINSIYAKREHERLARIAHAELSRARVISSLPSRLYTFLYAYPRP